MRKGQLLGILVTLVFLGLAFYRVDLAELGAALRRANYLLLAPAAVATLLGYLLRAVRWRVILTGSYAPNFGSLFSILMIGFATNNLLPARVGEFARAYLLGRQTGHRKTFTLATIVAERVFDGLVLITALAVLSALPLVVLPGWGHDVQRFSSAVFIVASAGVLVLLIRQRWAERVLGLIVRPLPSRLGTWAQAALAAFVTGLTGLRRPRTVVATVVLSLMIWTLEALSYYIVIAAFGLPLFGLQAVAASLLVLVVVNLGIMLPSAPGYIGTFQFFVVAALAIFQIPRESALALGIAAHLMQYLLVTGIGLFCLARWNLSLGRIAEERAALREGTLT